ncbi:MAG: phosphatidylcholine/phosphatidylserine synthase, partial [Deltaproteobacteria bacterium]
MTAATGPLRRAAAWAVHLLTASSAAAGILSVLAAERGAARTALAWMAYTVAVDSIDGTLARAAEVKRVLPIVDGTRLDDIVDYFTYVIVPVLFLLHADLLPEGAAVPVALCPVLASAVGFSRIDAKTPDHFFTG